MTKTNVVVFTAILILWSVACLSIGANYGEKRAKHQSESVTKELTSRIEQLEHDRFKCMQARTDLIRDETERIRVINALRATCK